MKNSKLFTIGEIADIKGMTVKALRFYEKIGLLQPYHVDPATRYRYYSIEQFVYLDIIKASRVMDISPKDLKKVMIKKDMNELSIFLAAQKENAERSLDEMKRSIRNIQAVQKAMDDAKFSITHTGVYRKKIPKRDIVTIDFNGATGPDETIVEFSRLDKIIGENRLTSTYDMGVLFRLDEKSIAQPERLFCAVGVEADSNTSVLSVIPAGEYVCVCYSKDNVDGQTEKLSKYLFENDLQPKSVLQVELLNDIFSWDTGCFELQILTT